MYSGLERAVRDCTNPSLRAEARVRTATCLTGRWGGSRLTIQDLNPRYVTFFPLMRASFQPVLCGLLFHLCEPSSHLSGLSFRVCAAALSWSQPPWLGYQKRVEARALLPNIINNSGLFSIRLSFIPNLGFYSPVGEIVLTLPTRTCNQRSLQY